MRGFVTHRARVYDIEDLVDYITGCHQNFSRQDHRVSGPNSSYLNALFLLLSRSSWPM